MADSPAERRTTPSVLSPVRSTFRAVATTVVPEAASLDEVGWSALEAIVEGALAGRPPRMRRQLRVLLRLIHAFPLVRYGRTFVRLEPARRARVLDGLQRSRIYLLRRGFWGLRTVILMGYYARPEAAREIGYRADPRGWEVVS